jgi:geranylgeranyl pyrophosphate synthase
MRKKNKKLMEKVQTLLKKRGQKAFEMAKDAILQEKSIDEYVYKALRYFIEESWHDVQHPALISMACEAVGGNPEKTTNIGAAMVLLAGAADVHDDIIDKSKIKNSKPTVLGKFGKEIAILVGDALLFKGLILLHEACKTLPKKQSQTILNLAKRAFFEIGNAEAKESKLKKKKYNLTPQEYSKVMEAKAAVAEASARIGAIIGCGKSKEVEALGSYGKILGILMMIRDDFIDLFEPEEIRNRAKNECLPLPILYVFQDATKKSEIAHLLKKSEITEEDVYKILDLIEETKEIQNLKKEMLSLIESGYLSLHGTIKEDKAFKLLLEATIEDVCT